MNIFFDLLIIILITATILPAVILLYHRYKDKGSWEQRHKAVSLLVAVLLLAAAATVVYGSCIEPRFLTVKTTSIDLEGINQPVKILLVADFQVGPYKQADYVQKVVDKILQLQPDLVLLAGDQINNSGKGQDETGYLQPLAQLAEKIPVYAINGNHEYGVSDGASFYDPSFRLPDLSAETKQAMEKLGITYLVNDLEKIKVKGQSFYLFGGDSFWAQKLDLSALKKRQENLPTIVLIHNPAAIFNAAGYGIDLMLAGHTHGGQIRLPFIGPLITVDHVIPRSWHQGWVDYNNTKMYVTSGAGETGVRSRLFTPPEIVELTIY